MNELDPRTIRGDGVITRANWAIRAKEELQASDVKWYLSEWLKAESTYDEDLAPLVTENRGALRRFHEAIETWDSDRSSALELLLSLIEAGHNNGKLAFTKDHVRCLVSLLEEPLIPDCDLRKYKEIAIVADRTLDLITEPHPLGALYSVYAHGVFYNAARFCPQILEEISSDVTTKNAPTVAKEFHDRFLADLETLQTDIDSGKLPKEPFFDNEN